MHLSERIADLSPSKRRLFLQRLREEVARRADLGSQAPPLRLVSREEGLPLSFAQERLWFLDQLEPGNTAYNMPAAYRLTGPLNVAALERSLNEIARRHEVLRTTLAAVDGRPIQVIAPTMNLTLPIVDLRDFPDTEQEAKAQRLATEEAQRPFDLAQGPLLRAALLRLGEEEHVLLLTMHHIVSDGWSTGVFNRELAVLYEAFSAGKPSPLPELSIQYADFAVWQREWLQGEVLEEQLGYWREQLGGDVPVLELPTDRPRPATQSFRGARQTLALSADLTEALKALSQQEECTLFMTLLAAFKVLLHRCTGQDDIVVGSPIAGRNRSEVEGLIGFFLNTLALRTDLSDNLSFRELLGRVREVTLGAYAHQDLPFEKLVAELQPERDLSRTPLFDIMLNFINTPQVPLELSGVTVSFEESAELESKFLMTLYVEERRSKLDLQLVYRQALFSAERMAFFLDQFRYLLEQVVAAPEKPIQSYSLVTPKSRPLLPDPSAVLPEPRYELVIDMFASWANNTPEHPAIRQGDRTWTYSTLAESAHTMARTLLAQGLERGDVVAMSGPRSFGLIASMMGVLLSGGVLLNIDQNLPVNRQRLMLREAAAKYLLYVGGQQTEDEWLQELLPLVIIGVDPDKGWAVEPERILDLEATSLPELTPDDAAYLFFTSGTTGVPKGVLGCHKGLSHFLNWQRETFAIRPEDRSAQLTALSFDVVLRDIFLPLTSGATLCLPEEELGPDQVLAWLERERISLLHTVPTLAQAWLMDVPAGVSLRSLRWVFFAGEPLPAALVRRWRGAFPESGEIVNLYGPTETTLAKCFYIVPSDTPPGVQPVGWPLPETQALVLAENGQMCGISEPGEIVLRTPFRSLGYVNAPEESQKRFVKNPFRDDERDLLYYTGDRGRYRPDGSLDILGRLDHQVKIRGVRIEPAEVTATLSQHPAVKSCFVVAREGEKGQTYLVAYVVKSKQDRTTIHELRLYLSKQLPAAMIPSTFITLDALPLTPNGKVDRRALPAPEVASREMERVFVAPRIPIEEELARIWTEVLGLKRVGVHDDFFDLGGHSLMAMQVVVRANQRGIPTTLQSLIQHPTISELADVVGSEAIHAEQGLVTGEAPCLPQQIHIFQTISDHKYFVMWAMLECDHKLDSSMLRQAVRYLVMHHDALRTRFLHDGNSWRQIFADVEESPVFSWIDLSGLSDTEQDSVIGTVARNLNENMSMSKGPLIQVAAFDLGVRRSPRLLVLVNHFVADGVSLRILVEDLETAYLQFVRGEAIELPSKTTSVKYYAERLSRFAKTVELRRMLDYWLNIDLTKVPPPLPVDFPGGSGSGVQATVSTSISKEETSTLLRQVPTVNGTRITDVMLTALVQSFKSWTGEPALLFRMAKHGRDSLFEDINLARTVGFLNASDTLLLDLGQAESPKDTLAVVQNQLRRAPARGISFFLGWFLGGDAETAKKLKRCYDKVEVTFNLMIESNHASSRSSLFVPVQAPIDLGVRFPSAPKLRIAGRINSNGQLEFHWIYDMRYYRRTTIENLAEAYTEVLKSLIAFVVS